MNLGSKEFKEFLNHQMDKWTMENAYSYGPSESSEDFGVYSEEDNLEQKNHQSSLYGHPKPWVVKTEKANIYFASRKFSVLLDTTKITN
jgi:hypothetical protein